MTLATITKCKNHSLDHLWNHWIFIFHFCFCQTTRNSTSSNFDATQIAKQSPTVVKQNLLAADRHLGEVIKKASSSNISYINVSTPTNSRCATGARLFLISSTVARDTIYTPLQRGTGSTAEVSRTRRPSLQTLHALPEAARRGTTETALQQQLCANGTFHDKGACCAKILPLHRSAQHYGP